MIGFSMAAFTVLESDSSLSVCLTLSTAPEIIISRDVTVVVLTVDGSAEGMPQVNNKSFMFL